MGKFIIIALIVAAAAYAYSKTRTPPLQAWRTNANGGYWEQTFDDISRDPNKAAEKGALTIVELSASTCSMCRKDEGLLKQLTEIRPDVVVKRVQIDNECPSGVPISDPLMIERCNRLFEDMQKVSGCGVPHVTMFAPDGKLLAQDSGCDHAGRNFMHKFVETQLASATKT